MKPHQMFTKIKTDAPIFSHSLEVASTDLHALQWSSHVGIPCPWGRDAGLLAPIFPMISWHRLQRHALQGLYNPICCPEVAVRLHHMQPVMRAQSFRAAPHNKRVQRQIDKGEC